MHHRLRLRGFLALLTSGVLLVSAPASTAELDTAIDAEFEFLKEAIGADEVESASKHRQSIFWSPSTITVINREDIYASGATNLGDLLRRVPGFDVYSLKCDYPVIGSRALTDDRNNLLLTLIDGREAAIELTGFPFYNALAVDLEEIERIEIVRGPGSTLYGANAYAGVVSITTVADRLQNGGDVSFSEGEEGRFHAFGRVRGSVGLGGGLLSVSAGGGLDGKRSHSDLDEEQFDVYRAHAYLRYRADPRLDLSFHFGAVGGDGLVYVHLGDMRIDTAREYSIMAKADVGLSDSTSLKAQLYYLSNSCGLTLRSGLWAYDLLIASIPHISWHTQCVDGKLHVTSRLLESLLLIGGGYVHYSFVDQENMVLNDDDELRGAVFVQVQWSPWEVLQLTGGVRLDVNTDTELAISPRAVAVLRPSDDQAFRASYGLAFRKPSFYENRIHLEIVDFNQATPEIVEKLATELGNEDLGNEKVHSFEAGWLGRFLDERLRVSCDLFYNIYLNSIDFEVDLPTTPMGLPDIPGSTLRFEHQDARIHAFGGEAEVVFRPGEAWSFWCNLGLRRVSDTAAGEHLSTEPVLRVNLGGRYLPPAGLLADVALHYVSAYDMPLMDPAKTLDPLELVPLGNRALVIARLGYRVPLPGGRKLEGGLTLRAPIGSTFREYAGIVKPMGLSFDTDSDFGGERLVRLVALYLRGSF